MYDFAIALDRTLEAMDRRTASRHNLCTELPNVRLAGSDVEMSEKDPAEERSPSTTASYSSFENGDGGR